MIASVPARADIDVNAVVEVLGLQIGPEYAHGYWDGSIHVEGITQERLASAVSRYDHMAAMRRRKLEAIRAERNRRLAETDRLSLRSRERGESGVEFAGSPAGLYRQRLRDLPNDLEAGRIAAWNAITTPEKYETFQPEWPT